MTDSSQQTEAPFAADNGARQSHGAPPLKVLVVDDHRSYGEALAIAMEMDPQLTCVGVATSIEDALTMVKEHFPDLAIIDVHLPGMDGIEGMGRLSKAHPDMSMLVVTGDSDVELVGRAIDAGAAGFFSKDVPLGEIMSALRQPRGRTMLVGGRTLNVVLAHLRERRQAPPKPQGAGRLTPRELEVLTLMGQGLDPKTIAQRLQLSIHTTRSYVKQILSKLEAHSQLEAVVQAQRMGVLPSS